jgi:hypothetical protein
VSDPTVYAYSVAPPRPDVVCGRPRSSHWPAVEHKFLQTHKECVACGSRNNLQVHHRKPFHLFPDLELDETNLIVGCAVCHFVLYHANDWENYVEDVDGVAFAHRIMVDYCRTQRASQCPPVE